VLGALGRATIDLPASRRAPIRVRFETASRYEWTFWDAAWRTERWPV